MSDLILRLNEFSPSWSVAMWRATWQGGLAIAVVWLLCLALPKTPARVRCWWWRLALAKLFISLVWATPIPIAVLRATATPQSVSPSLRTASISTQTALPPSIPVPPPQSPGIHAASAPTVKLNISTALLTFWSSAMLLGLLGILRRGHSARLLVRHAEPLGNDHSLQNECARLSRHFGLRSTPEIRVAEELSTPVLAGIRHPAILFPESFLQDKPPAQLRMMLAHELAHAKRRALDWAWLTIIARWLFFFHPLVWLARKEIALAEEMAADDLTLRLCQLEPADYAGMLVEVAARLFSPRQEELVVGVAASHQTLKRRLQAMKYITSTSPRRIAAAAIVTAIGLGLIVPWRLTAQESLPGIPVTRSKPVDDQDNLTVSNSTHRDVGEKDITFSGKMTEISIDAAGGYHYNGQIMSLNELLFKVKTAADTDPKIAVSLLVDRNTPYLVVKGLLEDFESSGIKKISLASQPLPPTGPQPLEKSNATPTPFTSELQAKTFRLQHADPKDAAYELALIFPSPDQVGYRAENTVTEHQRSDVLRKRISVQAVAEEETHSLLVTATPEIMREVEKLIEGLDSSPAHPGVVLTRPRATPQIFDIAFGVWRPAESAQKGPAAAGRDGDYWNAVGVPWNNDHTEADLKFASGELSPICARLVNLGGGWGNNGRMGVKSPMMDSYNYPVNNQGGNSEVTLTYVPEGTYDLYIYGHELDPVSYGDYTLTVGNRSYGRRTTSNKSDAVENTKFVEGSQYVKFARFTVGPSDPINIFIRPGGNLAIGNAGNEIQRTPAGQMVSAPVISDTVICGLQLIPAQ
jgi:beta-lactamase regulating signal transducer with metallopeptidase domain